MIGYEEDEIKDIFIVSVSYFIALIIIDDLTIVAFNFSSLIYFIDICFYMLMFFQFDTFSSFLEKGEFIFTNDKKFFHYTDPINVKKQNIEGSRDTLVITIKQF